VNIKSVDQEMEEIMKRLVATLFLSLFVLGVVAYADETSKARVLKGWISDSDCAAHGDKMCSNKEHIAKGAKLVFVTEADKKILTVSNPATVADHQGHHVQIKGVTDSEKSTITVQEVKMLK
jgi:hypothetical protein